MPRIDANVDRFLRRLSADLEESVELEQLGHMTNALGKLPENARLTSTEIDRISRELQLPAAHRATLIFALFVRSNAELVASQLSGQDVLSNLSGALDTLVSRAKKRGGEEVATALSNFFESYAGEAAYVLNTGVDLFDGVLPKLEVRDDSVRVQRKAGAVAWHEISFELTQGRSKGKLAYDGDGFTFKGVRIEKLDGDTIAVLSNALSAYQAANKTEQTAVRRFHEAVENAVSDGTNRSLLDTSRDLEIDIKVPVKRPKDLGGFVKADEGGWTFRSGQSSTPLGRLDIVSLQNLQTSLEGMIQAPRGRAQKTDQAIETARAVLIAGELNKEVGRILDARIREEAETRAKSEKTLREGLAGYNVAHIGAQLVNRLVQQFMPRQQSAE